MKVAHLTTVDQSLELLLGPQLSAAVGAGHEVVGISAAGPWVHDLERRGVRHLALPSSTRGMDVRADARAIWELAQILRRERPDILHTHNPKTGLYGRVLGRLSRTPMVVNTVHGLYATPEDRAWKRGLVYGLEAVASRFSHAELVQNPEDLALLERLRLVPKGRAKLLGNGVDLRRFDPGRIEPRTRAHTRAELGVAPDQVLVGCVARLVAEKGYRELIAAAELLLDDFAFVAVGGQDTDKADSLTTHEFERAKAAGIRLVGHRADVERFYAAMDLFVLPTHREGFPRAAMEAAAMGLPVIATNVRGCRQVVDHGLNGLLVEVGRADALAYAIRCLGEQPARRQAMSEASRRIACERFDEDRVVKIVMDTYETLRRKNASFTPGRVLG